MDTIIHSIRKELQSLQNDTIKASSLKFFKESIQTYGVRSAEVKRIAKQHKKQVSNMHKHKVFEICEELWKSKYIEESFIACHFSNYIQKQIIESDILIYSEWIQLYITNWATCDTFCNHTIGNSIMDFPNTIAEVKNWAYSENMWKRRAAAVSFIVPARRGLYKEHIFEIATMLMHDTEDLVQKGYGWMLKEASKPYCNDVFEFVMQHKKTMPRTALRYAIEKMPENLRKQAMQK